MLSEIMPRSPGLGSHLSETLTGKPAVPQIQPKGGPWSSAETRGDGFPHQRFVDQSYPHYCCCGTHAGKMAPETSLPCSKAPVSQVRFGGGEVWGWVVMVWSSPHLRGLEIQVGRLMVDFELKCNKPFIPSDSHLLFLRL